MKRLPISIQTFEKIISGDMIYVDKTMYLHELVSKGTYYFLSRPRRFGKSLLLTTLKSFFQGKKHLFEGLFIYEKEKEWRGHPVVHIDYSLVEYKKSRDIFVQSLMSHLRMIAKKHGIVLKEELVGNAFTELVETLFEKHGPVVVLVDEYDKAMVDTLTDETRFDENRDVLRNLYGALKGLDNYLRFVMLTGVSRFAKVNVFSGLNNLTDISDNDDFANIVGFTQEELEGYFSEWVQKVNDRTFQVPPEELMAHIKFMYNGFSFDGKTKLYNPFSVLSLFTNLNFGNFWFSSGTPTFLIDLIKEQKQLPETFENLKTADLTGYISDIKNFPLYPLLYQTGYLTIKKVEYDGFSRSYYLGYPNEEVRQSFIRYIAAAFVGKDQYDIQPEALELRYSLRQGDTEAFTRRLQSFLADIPYQLHIPAEKYYHSLVYMMLRLVGVKLDMEKPTDKGRIDAVLELPDMVYVIEFKFGKKGGRIKRVKTLSRQAVEQIKKNKYYEPYLSGGKKIILFGMGFLNKELHGRAEVLEGG